MLLLYLYCSVGCRTAVSSTFFSKKMTFLLVVLKCRKPIAYNSSENDEKRTTVTVTT